MLKYPEVDNKFDVHTDARGFAIGGVLMQDGHLVVYESSKLMGSQLKWPTHEKYYMQWSFKWLEALRKRVIY